MALPGQILYFATFIYFFLLMRQLFACLSDEDTKASLPEMLQEQENGHAPG